MTDQAIWTNFDHFLTTNGDELPLIDSERYVSFSLTDLWPSWQREGRCFGVGSNYFFGDEKQQPTMSIKQVRQASKLCDVCPVYRECLRWALENNEEYGVWAGTSGRTRRKIQKVLGTGQATVDQVIEDFTHGRREKYTPRPEPGSRDGGLGFLGEDPSRTGLRAESCG